MFSISFIFIVFRKKSTNDTFSTTDNLLGNNLLAITIFTKELGSCKL